MGSSAYGSVLTRPNFTWLRSPRRGRQVLVVVGLLALAFAVLIIGGIAFAEVWTSPYIGFWRSLGSNEVYRVDPDSPGAMAGVRLGDVLTHVDGVPIDDAVPLFGGKGVGRTARFSLVRGPIQMTLEVFLAPPPPQEQVGRLIYLALGLAFWALGMAVFIRKPLDPTARAFLTLCLWAAGALTVLPLTGLQVDWANRAINVCVLLAATGFIHFHATFPRRLSWPGWAALVTALYVVTAGLAAVYVAVGPFRLDDYAWFPALERAVRLYFASAILVGLALLLSAYWTSESGAVRRRVRLVTGGSVMAFLLPVLLIFVPEAFTGHTLIPYEVGIASLIFIPLAYSYGIYRDDLMAVDFALYRLLVYLIVAALLLVGYLVLVTLAGHLLSPQLAHQPLTGAIASLLVAASFSPVQHGVQMTLNRAFYGPSYDYLAVLADSGRRLAEGLDEATLVDVLTVRVTEAIGISQTGLWIADDDGQLHWVGGRLAPACDKERGRRGDKENQVEGLLVPPSPGPLVTPSPLMQQLRGGRIVPQRTDTDEPDLGGPVRWWVPLTLGSELQGLWVVGPRRGDESFSPVDRRLLRAAADQGAMVIKVTRLLEALRHQLAQSEAHREELAQVYRRLAHSREEERKRLAMELHDEVIQSLAGFNLFLQEARREAGQTLDAQLGDLQAQVRQIIANTRRICKGLRPATLDKLGLVPALRALAREVTERAGLAVHLELAPADVRLGEDVEAALYRLVQEGLNNIAHHAQARQVQVRLQVTTDVIDLTIQDDGQGFKLARTQGAPGDEQRLGLISMRERVAGLGGRLTIDSAAQQGTLVRARIPRTAQPEGNTRDEVS